MKKGKALLKSIKRRATGGMRIPKTKVVGKLRSPRPKARIGKRGY